MPRIASHFSVTACRMDFRLRDATYLSSSLQTPFEGITKANTLHEASVSPEIVKRMTVILGYSHSMVEGGLLEMS